MLNCHLVLGGARSGKSAYAENLAIASGKSLIYLATASAEDEEMAARITHHKKQRAANKQADWQLVECQLSLADALAQHATEENCILVDCLTLWLSNCLCQKGESFFQQEKQKLLNVIENFSGQIIFVSNEVGHGIVPMGELSRTFVDQAGWLHQTLATQAKTVDFIIAGLPMRLEGQDISLVQPENIGELRK